MFETFIRILFIFTLFVFITFTKMETNTMIIQYIKNFKNVQNFPKDKDACPGQGIHIQNAFVFVSLDHKKAIHRCGGQQLSRSVGLEMSNNDYDQDVNFLRSLRRECNGKPRCDIIQSATYQLHVTCSFHEVETDAIKLIFVCKPVVPNGDSVFDMSMDIRAKIGNGRSSKAVYLTKSGSGNRKCRIETKQSKTTVGLLHADWCCPCSNNSGIHRELLVKFDSREVHTCQINNSPTIYFYNVVAIEKFSKATFLWIEIAVAAGVEMELICEEGPISGRKETAEDNIALEKPTTMTQEPLLDFKFNVQSTAAMSNLPYTNEDNESVTFSSEGQNQKYLLRVTIVLAAVLAAFIVILLSLVVCAKSPDMLERVFINRSKKKEDLFIYSDCNIHTGAAQVSDL